MGRYSRTAEKMIMLTEERGSRPTRETRGVKHHTNGTIEQDCSGMHSTARKHSRRVSNMSSLV